MFDPRYWDPQYWDAGYWGEAESGDVSAWLNATEAQDGCAIAAEAEGGEQPAPARRVGVIPRRHSLRRPFIRAELEAVEAQDGAYFAGTVSDGPRQARRRREELWLLGLARAA